MAGRKSVTEKAEAMSPEIVGKTPAVLADQEREMNEARQMVVAKFGDDLPWHPDHYESEIRGELKRGCDAFLRAGRLLLVARACAAHGEWQGMLGRLGLERSQSQRMMEAARRIASLPNGATSQHLTKAVGSQSKLIELLSLPEDQFADLAETGEIDGLSLDDVQRMSVNELRNALRDARETITTKDERASKREKDIERLEGKVRKVTRELKDADPDDVATKLREAVVGCSLGIRGQILAYAEKGEPVHSLRTHFAALVEHGETTGVDHKDFLAGVIGELLGDLRRLRDRDEFLLPIVNDSTAA